MNFFEMTKARYSVRKYADRPVEAAKLDAILEAARNAPTANNNQPQKIFVMQSPGALDRVDSFTRGRFKAPLVMVICYDKNKSWKRKDGYDAGEVDCGIIGTHIMFAALEQGLGTCWVAMFNEATMRTALGIPDNLIPVAVIALGYPDDSSAPYRYHYERKPLEETVEFQ